MWQRSCGKPDSLPHGPVEWRSAAVQEQAAQDSAVECMQELKEDLVEQGWSGFYLGGNYVSGKLASRKML